MVTSRLVRMAEELHALTIDLGKLQIYIDGDKFPELDAQEQCDLRGQAKHMCYYRSALARRVHRLAGEVAYS